MKEKKKRQKEFQRILLADVSCQPTTTFLHPGLQTAVQRIEALSIAEVKLTFCSLIQKKKVLTL
jgi:hypothetical protein